MNIFGIDYGSRLAGTTVIAHLKEGEVNLLPCPEKQDADRFVFEHAMALQPGGIGLDAPQSLPGKYYGLEACTDFFYRRADRLLGAMSPMFLGGLTARAMRLKEQLERKGLQVVEVYPAIWARRLGLPGSGYKKKNERLQEVVSLLQQHLPFRFESAQVNSWHAVDALLATYATCRFASNIYEAWGDPREGQIIV